jgi:hypothetical protein
MAVEYLSENNPGSGFVAEHECLSPTDHYFQRIAGVIVVGNPRPIVCDGFVARRLANMRKTGRITMRERFS